MHHMLLHKSDLPWCLYLPQRVLFESMFAHFVIALCPSADVVDLPHRVDVVIQRYIVYNMLTREWGL
jgi:hypothetical protein